jgi:hypothetical protein
MPKRGLSYFPSRSSFSFCGPSTVLIMGGGLLLGAFLRLYQIGSQIIWDDEWHGINVALFHPLRYILTHFHSDDNCIPLSLYLRIMLKSVGLNEMIVRAPSLLSGLLILIVFPLYIKKLVSARVALIFQFLVAISPLLVYFSRLARPYSIVVFLSFISIFSFYFWLLERKSIYAVIYVVSAILAPYFSLSALAFVLTPILYALAIHVLKASQKGRGAEENRPRLKHIGTLGLMVLCGIAAWLLPAAGSLGEVINKGHRGFISLGTLGGSAILFGGGRSYAISFLLTALLIYGSHVLYSSDRKLFSYVATICFVQFLFLAISRPFLVQSSMIFTRYFASAIPVWLLCISIALHDLLLKLNFFLRGRGPWLKRLPSFAMISLFIVLFFGGPLPRAYSFPNSFTNHQDFQYSYLRPLPRIDDPTAQACSEFYVRLKDEAGDITIVESPAILSWYWNPFHIYQRWHRKRVIVGYASDRFGPFFGYHGPVHDLMRFRNFVDLLNPQTLRINRVRFVVVHRNIYEEAAAVRLPSTRNSSRADIQLPTASPIIRQQLDGYVNHLVNTLDRYFGQPVFEDEWIRVYKVA